MIEVTGLIKRYGAFTAVKDLSFAVRPGEVLGLVGPNGAGKTSTLRCLAGIIPATAGIARIAGHDITADPVPAKRALAFFPDEPRLFDYLTVRQHLAFVARIYGVPHHESLTQPLLEELEIADKADQLPGELSRGMKQKLAIACGLIHSPAVMFFDEPLTGLDPLGIRRMKDSILQRARAGATIVLSSHLLHLLEEVCSHVLILKKGEKIADGTIAEVSARFSNGEPNVSLEEIFIRATGGTESYEDVPMVGALLYLRLTSLQNLLQSRFKRLKQPKYFSGAIVGAAYFWFFIFRRMFFVPTGAVARGVSPELQSLPLMIIAVPIILIGMKRVIEAWIAPDDKPGLAFTEAEVAFLFPAPMTRRVLVHYKLLSTQVTILISSCFLGLLASRWVALGGNYLTHVAGFWVMFSTLNLHTTGAAFTVTRLIEGGVSKIRRQVVVTGVILLFLAAAAYTAWRTAPPPTAAETASPLKMMHYVSGLTEFGVLYWLTLPFKIVLGPLLAAHWIDFLRALGPALVLLAAHYIWVVRAETSFEEASIALAEKRTALIAAMKEGKYRLGASKPTARREPFRLAPAGGRPELAFLWKNLLSTSAFFRPRTFFVAAGVIVVGWGWLTFSPGHRSVLGVVAGMSLVLAGYIVFFGPQVARQDLRSDLSHADILKSYPLAGWQILLGEILAPTAILTGLLWLALLTATLAFQPHGFIEVTPALRVVGACGIAAIIPVLCALQLLVPNAAVVLFPGWMHATRHRGERGVEMLGQRLIFVAGQLLVIVIALLPAAGGAALLVFITQRFIGMPAAVGLAAVAVFAILVAEVGCGLWLIGERFEKFDLSAELRP